MELTAFVAVTATVLLGALVQTTTGVGGGFIMVPLLALIDLSLVPAPLIFASMALSIAMALRERADIDWVHMPLIMLGMLPGAVVGAWLITRVPLERLGIVFGFVILIGVGVTAVGKTVRPTRYSALAAGGFAGVTSASAGIGAPILALLYQHETGARLRGTLALLYTSASTLVLLVLAGFNRFGTREMIAGAYLVPGFIVGYLIARRFVVRMDDTRTRIGVLVVCATAAIALIVRSIPEEVWP